MTRVMCNPWKRTFTLVPLAPLTMFSPKTILQSISHASHNSNLVNGVIIVTPIAIDIQELRSTP
jgi:hypothetical protein